MAIPVALGVILDSEQRVLIAERHKPPTWVNLWEFPGGKIEAGETPEQALVRELLEEVGIEPLQWQPFTQIQHRYTERDILLHVFLVTHFSGAGYGREQQAVKWVPLSELHQYEFPGANQPIIELLLQRL